MWYCECEKKIYEPKIEYNCADSETNKCIMAFMLIAMKL